MIYDLLVSGDQSKTKTARTLPEPAKVTEGERQAAAKEAKAWRAEVLTKVAAVEAVTDTDMKARAC